jgi:hypothetical protein
MINKLALTLLFGILGIGAYGQTIKSLGYNTTNGQVVYNGTNTLTFTNDVKFGSGDLTVSGQVISGGGVSLSFEDGALSGAILLETNSSIVFQGASAATTRTNLGLGATWLTNTNVTNFRTAIGLGATNDVSLNSVTTSDGVALTTYGVSGGGYNGELDFEENQFFAGDGDWNFSGSGVENMGIIGFFSATNAAVTRTNLGLGNGITTNRTFVSYNGTNYTTNSVTISNGIITGWTQ